MRQNSKLNISVECGALVRELRLVAGLSQDSLALRIKTDGAYISLIERGGRNVTLVSLERIVNGVGSTFSDFLVKLAARL